MKAFIGNRTTITDACYEFLKACCQLPVKIGLTSTNVVEKIVEKIRWKKIEFLARRPGMLAQIIQSSAMFANTEDEMRNLNDLQHRMMFVQYRMNNLRVAQRANDKKRVRLLQENVQSDLLRIARTVEERGIIGKLFNKTVEHGCLKPYSVFGRLLGFIGERLAIKLGEKCKLI